MFRFLLPIAILLLSVPVYGQVASTEAPSDSQSQRIDIVAQRLDRIEASLERLTERQVARATVESGPLSSQPESVQSRAMDFDSVRKAILEALDRDNELGRFQKRRLERILQSPFRGRAQREIVGFASSRMLAAQVIEPTPDGVMTAVDWPAILTFLEGLLPLIVQLINLFG